MLRMNIFPLNTRIELTNDSSANHLFLPLATSDRLKHDPLPADTSPTLHYAIDNHTVKR
jgi:hypothetical protein